MSLLHCAVVHFDCFTRHRRHSQHVLLFRPAKGGDDSDDEEGASRPKKQRKPKERKKFEKVL